MRPADRVGAAPGAGAPYSYCAADELPSAPPAVIRSAATEPSRTPPASSLQSSSRNGSLHLVLLIRMWVAGIDERLEAASSSSDAALAKTSAVPLPYSAVKSAQPFHVDHRQPVVGRHDVDSDEIGVDGGRGLDRSRDDFGRGVNRPARAP